MTRLADLPGGRIYTPYKRRLSVDEVEQGRERDESSIDFDAQPGAVLAVQAPEEWEQEL